MKKLFLAFIILSCLCVKCQKAPVNVIGFYKIYEPNYIDKLFRAIKYKSWIVGTTLEIKSDSSFVLINCSMINQGNWRVKNDTLYLTVVEKTFRIDSLNYSAEWQKYRSIKSIPWKYKTNGKYLENVYADSIGRNTLEKLEKIR